MVGGRGGAEVPADADGGLDHGASAEEYVLRAVELGFAGYFVAGFGLDVVAAGGGAGLGWHGGLEGRWSEFLRELHEVN